jgi:hypothetical protein
MNKALVASILLPSLICALVGCAYTAHVQGIMGYAQQSEIPDAALICVAVDPEVGEVELSKEITKKLEILLSRKGFKPANSSEAEYFLFFDFERRPLMSHVGLTPIGGIKSGIRTYSKEGPFELTLSLRLVESSSYLEKGLEEFSWAGGAIMSNTPTESTKFADMLLVAAMKYFPLETAEVRDVKIGLYDFRARRLRR